MNYKVHFLPADVTAEVLEETTILEAARNAGVHIDAPCGGMGTCGKCKVRITEGSEPGVVLACQERIEEDLTVNTLLNGRPVEKILTEGIGRKADPDPGISPEKIAAEQGRTEETGILRRFFLMAFDIGTTTVVGYLLDGRSGALLETVSRVNPQRDFGADVITRANYVLENGEEGGRKLRECIVSALNDLILEAAEKAGISREEILQAAIVGNTCMHHLFLGISPDSLVHAPYVPAVKKALELSPEETGLHIHPQGKVLMLPNIAGFVGGDTVGCMLALAFDRLTKMTLMVDIGTNGEMVLGNWKKMLTTSTAAGPAFEGAKIECGMRGSEGAVSHFREKEDGSGIELEIVGRGTYDLDEAEKNLRSKAAGICGSGLIDVVAFFVRHGIITEMGAFRDTEDLTDPLALRYRDRIFIHDGQPAFRITEKSGRFPEVYVSQKDVREVQLAKGAIAAGIEILSDKLGIQTSDIEQVYLAGAFGNYMDPASACEIGLIPYELRDRIRGIGNAAGEGAKLAVLSRKEFAYAERLADETEFVELATEKSFQDVYVDQLMFDRACGDDEE